LSFLVVFGGALSGCSDETNNGDQGAQNNNTGEPDGGGDAGDVAPDAQPDVAPDADPQEDPKTDPEPDAEQDVAPDVEPDAEQDAEQDAQPDVEQDVAPDVEEDTGPQGPGPLVLAVSPNRGPVEGGAAILIEGANLTQDTDVFLGTRRVQNIEVLSETQLVGVTPPGVLGSVDVKVANTLGDDTIARGYTYFEPLALESVDPPSSPTRGGETVLLRGRGLNPDVIVTVGGRAAIEVLFVSEELLQITTPAGAAGPADVRVLDRNSESVLVGGITYFEAVDLDRVEPGAAPRAGGVEARLLGRGFTPEARAQFGGLEATTTFVSPQELRVVVPPGPTGFVDVVVRDTTGIAGLVNGFYYFAPGNEAVSLYGIGPSVGPAGGGQQVTIIGENLDGGELVVELGGRPVVIQSASATTLVGLTPPGTVGDVDLRVETAEGEAVLEDAYTYVPTLDVTGVTPGEGPVEGGNEVVIAGEGFGDDAVAYFGPQRARVVERSATSLRVVVPPGSLGLVDVEVRSSELREVLEGAYRYTQPVQVFGIDPTSGSISGGTFVQVRGLGFASAPTVMFGRVEAEEVTLVDTSTLVVRTPPNREGAVDVSFDFGGGVEVRSPDRYTYFNPGTRFGGVWGDEVDGAVNVSVFSTGGGAIGNAFVTLSVDAQSPFQGFTNELGQITFSAQNLEGRQTVTAVAAGFSSATVQSFNAENVTVFLSPLDGQGGPPGGPPTGTITGYVSGVEKIGDPGPNEFELAIVYTTTPGPFRGNPATGNGNVLLGNGEYTLISRVGDVAVIVVAGLFNNLTEEFTPYAMGVRRYLFVSQNQTYNVDLEADILLDHPITFKLNGAPRGPNGPNINRVLPYLDFGFEGTFGNLDFAEGQGEFVTAEHMPALEGVLADTSYFVLGGAWTGQNAPYSLAILEDVREVDEVVELPTLLGVPTPLNPPDGGRVVNNYIEFSPNSPVEPDFYYIEIEQLDRTPVWTVILPGNEPFFQLPELPDFRELPRDERPQPYVGGALLMNVTSAKAFNFDYDNFEYNDFGLDNWESFTATGWVIQLR
jgi:hypothetical protein